MRGSCARAIEKKRREVLEAGRSEETTKTATEKNFGNLCLARLKKQTPETKGWEWTGKGRKATPKSGE